MTVDAQTFKEALAHWASGVTVVTTITGGKPVGITASSFSSVSLNPPLVMVCVDKKLYTHGAILEQQAFTVNILGVQHKHLGMRFAGMIPEIEDRFADLDEATAATGCPVLRDALGWVDCTLFAAHDSGDHTIFVGEVMAAAAKPDGDPILYWNRGWRALEDGTI